MKKIVITFLLLGVFSPVLAQISIFPISRNNVQLKKTQLKKSALQLFKIEEDTALQLPFFEDFSTTTVGTIDTNKWLLPTNVFVNNFIPLNTPTKNAVTFDGTRADGSTYSPPTNPTLQGGADTLVSRQIDLSQDNNELYFSFMWQARGNAETPDTTDFLQLEFMDVDSTWQEVWRQQGGRVNTTRFEHVIFPVDDEVFFHPHFQFRFSSFNRLSGLFDVWNVDYIYLNSDRSESDTSFLDIAASRTPEFFTSPYSAIPYEHFWNDTTLFLTDTLRSSVSNLDEVFNVLSYQCEVRNAKNEEVLGYWYGLNSDSRSSSDLIDEFERDKPIIAIPYASLLPQNADSMVIRHEFQVNTREPDENFGGVSTRINDTISQTTFFKDFYAYDDGTAEFGAGINQRFGQLAYQYYIGTPDILTHIDIYFAQLGRSVENQTYNIRVWKKLDFSRTESEDDILLTQNVILRYADSLNQFSRIKLSRSLDVSDTIYIGIQQLGDNMIPIGLDMQTNSSERMFFNVRNFWEQNQTLEGSLMLRPVFREEIVTSIEDDTNSSNDLVVYPNPNSSGTVRIKGKVDAIQLIDLAGKELAYWSFENGTIDDKEITLPSNLRSGMYLLKCQYGNTFLVKKLILQR